MYDVSIHPTIHLSIRSTQKRGIPHHPIQFCVLSIPFIPLPTQIKAQLGSGSVPVYHVFHSVTPITPCVLILLPSSADHNSEEEETPLLCLKKI